MHAKFQIVISYKTLKDVLIEVLKTMLEVFKSTSSKLILGLVIILVAGLQYSFWWGEGGYFPHQALTQQIAQQAEQQRFQMQAELELQKEQMRIQGELEKERMRIESAERIALAHNNTKLQVSSNDEDPYIQYFAL